MTPGPRRYILDTNILLAYIRAGGLGQHIEAKYGLRASPFRPLICVVSVGEVRALGARNRWNDEKTVRMNELLSQVVWVDISEPGVLDAYVAVVNSRPKGWEIRDNDKWIAAAAAATKACLLTTDTDFDYLAGKLIEREWIDPKLGKSPGLPGTA